MDNQSQTQRQEEEFDIARNNGIDPLSVDPEIQDDPGVNDLPASQVDQQPKQQPPVQQPAAPQQPTVEQEAPAGPKIDPIIDQSTTGKDFSIPNLKDANALNLSEAALMTKKKLALEAKVPFYIPFDAGESKGATRTATINGYPFTVLKGEYVELPVTVVKLFMRSMNMEAAALSNNPFNMNNPGSINNPGFRKDAAI